MWLMLQNDTPEDFVIATGEMHTVREFCEIAFDYVGLDYKKYVIVDEKFFRPAEVHELLGDASKARKILKWQPETSFEQLIKMMVDSDMKIIEKIKCEHF